MIAWAWLLTAALAEPALRVPPDRSAPPAVPPAAPVDLPHAPAQALGPGTTVAWVPLPGLSRATVAIGLELGAIGLDGGVTAAVDAWMALLGEATADLDAPALADRMRRLDLTLGGDVDGDHVWLLADMPRDALADGLVVLEQVLHRPAWDRKQLKVHAREVSYSLRLARPSDIDDAAADALHHAWYPPDHPDALPRNPADSARLRTADLDAVHARLTGAGRVDVVIAGDVDPAAHTDAIARVVRGFGAAVPRDAGVPAAPTPTARRTVAVHVAGATQAAIRVRLPAPAARHADAPAFDAASHALGGHFLARINRVLREEKGWTYGGYGNWSADRVHGMWTFSVQVPAERAADALAEITTVLDTFLAEGPTDAELDAFRTATLGDHNDTLSSGYSAAGTWLDLALHDETVADHVRLRDARLAVDAATVRSAARAWLSPARALVVVAGDRDALTDVLSGLDPTWVDAADAVTGDLPEGVRP